MAIAEDNFPFFSDMFATNMCMQKAKCFFNLIIICMSYDANNSVQFKTNLPFYNPVCFTM